MKRKYPTKFLLPFCLIAAQQLCAQAQPKANDVTAPLHLMPGDYKTPYGKTTQADVKATIDRVFNYLDATTPPAIINNRSEEVKDLSQVAVGDRFKPGDFRLTSYEWGVTYAGMLLAGETTGDKRYTDYSVNRINFLADAVFNYKNLLKTNPQANTPLNSVINPKALDDAGAVCAAMIKVERSGAAKAHLRPVIDNYANYIMTKEFRLADGTLARNRPLPNTLWLDDMFMSLPALAQMGKLTGDKKYYDEVVKQFGLFGKRMFNKEKGVYMHGWVQDMAFHPQFHWGRANGWALMTTVEILDVLPATHPGRAAIVARLKEHINGLAAYQDGTGFWHQLLDKNDTYLETSATAIYAYAIAHAIDKGWIDAKVYGPMAILAWNAVSTKVNEKGQVEGTCVGTGMAFDPAFYYARPVSVAAAHGYGPVLLAGGEMYRMLKDHPFVINDSAVMVNK